MNPSLAWQRHPLGFAQPLHGYAQGFWLWALPMFQDNYAWGLTQQDSGQGNINAWLVDPGDAKPMNQWLSALSVHYACPATLRGLFLTHRHADHIGGVADLVRHFPDCAVYGPPSISGVNQPLADGDTVSMSPSWSFKVLALPGHVSEHLGYVSPEIFFVGDTVFSFGCGRVFDDTPAILLASLRRLIHHCDMEGINPLVCAAHEYTVQNLNFCLSVLPDEQIWQERRHLALAGRAQGLPTLPFRLRDEVSVSPWLSLAQGDSHYQAPLAKALGINLRSSTDASTLTIFTALRERRNHF